MPRARILVVEDRFIVAEDISASLARLGYDVCGTADSGEEAVELAKVHCPSLVLMDIRLAGEIDGVEAAARLRRELDIPVVYLTAHSDDATLERAAATEPLGYLLKPFDERQLYTTIELALNRRRAERQKKIPERPVRLEESISEAVAEHPETSDLSTEEIKELLSKPEFGPIVASHPSMIKLLESICLVAKTDVTVHIYGENGTGKELVAESVHNLSSRKVFPFIKLNCSAIPTTLLESALFGHVRGSFTSASKDQEGFIESAEGGTLFLDEIGDISHEIQVKLLRLLQSREYMRIGETRIRKADVRIVTATNKNLKDLVKEGKLREDFYYRIHVFPLIVPPLRERRSDVMLIAEHYRRLFNKLFDKRTEGFAPDAVESLVSFDWPGNVRQLENAIRYAFVVVPSGTITSKHLPQDITASARTVPRAPVNPATYSTALQEQTEAVEREAIVNALEQTGGDRTKAAKLLGFSRTTLWKKMNKLGLSSPKDTDGDSPTEG